METENEENNENGGKKMTSDIFDDLFGGFDAMNRRFEALFSDLKNYDNVKTYGYTIYRGPDGVPHVYEYGNAVDERHMIGDNVNDPLTDVTVDGDNVRIVIEVPGLKKEDIELEVCDDSVKVSANTEKRKVDKTIPLPHADDPDSTVAVYNNGILEITLKSLEAKPKGKRIEIQ